MKYFKRYQMQFFILLASDYPRLVAINAVKALRELTPELIDAGDIQIEFDSSFELAWHTMIDRIVNE